MLFIYIFNFLFSLVYNQQSISSLITQKVFSQQNFVLLFFFLCLPKKSWKQSLIEPTSLAIRPQKVSSRQCLILFLNIKDFQKLKNLGKEPQQVSLRSSLKPSMSRQFRSRGPRSQCLLGKSSTVPSLNFLVFYKTKDQGKKVTLLFHGRSQARKYS